MENEMSKDYLDKEGLQWSLYDSNVQQYRATMISSQALLLAVVAIFFDKNSPIVFLISFSGLFAQWYIWYRIISRRAFISDYHKFNFLYGLSLYINENGDSWKEGDHNLSERTYTKNNEIRKKANNWVAEKTENPELKRSLRTTRFKLDVIIPVLFSIIWLFILYLALFSKDCADALPNMETGFHIR